MTWSCAACTFDNESDEATVCVICDTLRGGVSRTLGGNELDMKSTQTASLRSWKVDVEGTAMPVVAKKPANTQLTLFGGIASNVCSDPAKIAKKKNAFQRGKTSELGTAPFQPPISKLITYSERQVSHAPYDVLEAQANQNVKTIFGIDKLRNLQPIAIKNALQRKSQIIVMATGGGKSLCYQLPASVLGGVTLVISPLIALMVDQVQTLIARGIEAALLSSASGERNNTQVLERLLGRSLNANTKKTGPPLKPLRLVYCTPELIQTARFQAVVMELHSKNCLALVAIDEAHCLSTWGHDFRPAYRKLSWLCSLNLPIMACTATATPKVIQDIRETLRLPEDQVPCHLSSFNRPNISYQVRFKDSLNAMRPGGAIADLVALIKEKHGQSLLPCSGIVYVHKRDDTSYIAKQISSSTNIPAAAYHAGLKDAERTQVQQDWTTGKIKVAVATVAFGMGIDLGHVRYVLHWTLAKSIEGFYQESGRAGRDGQQALSVLYYSKEDASRFGYIIRKSVSSRKASSRKQQEEINKSAEEPLVALEQMVNYCIVTGCRRQFLLAHFGEKIDPRVVCSKTCDYCENPTKVQKEIQASDVVKDVLKSAGEYMRRMDNKEWDGQWDRPHGDVIDDDRHYFDERWKDNLLNTTGEDSDDWEDFELKSTFQKKRKHFEQTSSVLAKYERMESNKESCGGFVTFCTRGDGPNLLQRPVEIPQHLRDGLPDPLVHLAKKPDSESKSSADLSCEAQRVREKLEKLKQVAHLAALRAKSAAAVARPPPPPPPTSLTFKKNRR